MLGQSSPNTIYISDCYMQVLACIATQYMPLIAMMPIRVQCIQVGMYYVVCIVVCIVVYIEYIPACIQY